MHACSPSVDAPMRVFSRPSRLRAGFSLVEVTMAIGIVAFAFVALLGLLPTGLQVFRESIDSANEMWITQNLNSMVQVTSWDKIKDLEKFTFYFDEEGRMTDRVSPETGETADEEIKLKRIYAVKLLISKPVRPGDGSSGEAGVNAFSENVWRVVAVMAPCMNVPAMKEFESMNDADDVDAKEAKRNSIKTRAFLVSRMESMREV